MVHTEADDADAVDLGAGAPPAAHPRDPSGDAALVGRARAGDRHAMTELYRRYARMIHGILLARVAATEADDLVQEVFVHAIGRLSSLREPAAFGGWLATVARNKAVDHHRRGKGRGEELKDEHAAPGGSAVKRLRALEALEAIRRLPEAYREVLVLRLVEGMTGPEIAGRTGLTPGSVRVNLCRGMSLLRAELGTGGEVLERESEP
jgi:RNA polymerase sigma-70 factor, ECF subfamily